MGLTTRYGLERRAQGVARPEGAPDRRSAACSPRSAVADQVDESGRRYHGDTAAARESYRGAATMTASLPEQRRLTQRAARLRHPALAHRRNRLTLEWGTAARMDQGADADTQDVAAGKPDAQDSASSNVAARGPTWAHYPSWMSMLAVTLLTPVPAAWASTSLNPALKILIMSVT